MFAYHLQHFKNHRELRFHNFEEFFLHPLEQNVLKASIIWILHQGLLQKGILFVGHAYISGILSTSKVKKI